MNATGARIVFALAARLYGVLLVHGGWGSRTAAIWPRGIPVSDINLLATPLLIILYSNTRLIRTALWLPEAVEAYRIIIIVICRAEGAHVERCVVKLKPPCRNAATVSTRELTLTHLLADTHH